VNFARGVLIRASHFPLRQPINLCRLLQFALLAGLGVFALSVSTAAAQTNTGHADWRLVWSDEFNEPRRVSARLSKVDL